MYNKCVIKRRLNFADYNNYLNARKIKNKIKALRDDKYFVDELKENHE